MNTHILPTNDQRHEVSVISHEYSCLTNQWQHPYTNYQLQVISGSTFLLFKENYQYKMMPKYWVGYISLSAHL